MKLASPTRIGETGEDTVDILRLCAIPDFGAPGCGDRNEIPRNRRPRVRYVCTVARSGRRAVSRIVNSVARVTAAAAIT
ncbi:uncharacterized protein RMCN_0101 [Mycolicibacterium novocastrense]|uniref:Uncharacterized protein n=1 Tax=Mycolicibacterium novocastrense TaxID=59813 RepID=A0ABQ0KCI5_MYCNV|nr:uncharacterized protein RMCN_0101 [Mycolicibacterium novocastrense]